MTVGKSERVTQDRVIALFRKELGYRFLGDRSDRDNSNIEESLLSEYLQRVGYSEATISRALYLLRTEANHPNRSLYENNKAVYALLRYGVKVKTTAGEDHETVSVIDWSRPDLVPSWLTNINHPKTTEQCSRKPKGTRGGLGHLIGQRLILQCARINRHNMRCPINTYICA